VLPLLLGLRARPFYSGGAVAVIPFGGVMANARDIPWQFAPDLDVICKAMGTATEAIFAAGMWDEPQVKAVADAIVSRLSIGKSLVAEQAAGGVVFALEDDELLALLAKWQALHQVAITRLQGSGGCT
jgi:hypothetical protein